MPMTQVPRTTVLKAMEGVFQRYPEALKPEDALRVREVIATALVLLSGSCRLDGHVCPTVAAGLWHDGEHHSIVPNYQGVVDWAFQWDRSTKELRRDGHHLEIVDA